MSQIFRIAKIEFSTALMADTELVFGNKYQIDKYCEKRNHSYGSKSTWDFVNVDDATYIDLSALTNLTEIMATVPDAGTVIWFVKSNKKKFNITVPDLEHSKFLQPVTINHSEGFKPNTQEDCQNLINYLEAIKNSLPKGSN